MANGNFPSLETTPNPGPSPDAGEGGMKKNHSFLAPPSVSEGGREGGGFVLEGGENCSKKKRRNKSRLFKYKVKLSFIS